MILWMVGRNPCNAPKKPDGRSRFPNVNIKKRYGFNHGFHLCEMDFVHPQYSNVNQELATPSGAGEHIHELPRGQHRWLVLPEELVPGFKDKIPAGRLESAAELTNHQRAKARCGLSTRREAFKRPVRDELRWMKAVASCYFVGTCLEVLGP